VGPAGGRGGGAGKSTGASRGVVEGVDGGGAPDEVHGGGADWSTVTANGMVAFTGGEEYKGCGHHGLEGRGGTVFPRRGGHSWRSHPGRVGRGRRDVRRLGWV